MNRNQEQNNYGQNPLDDESGPYGFMGFMGFPREIATGSFGAESAQIHMHLVREMQRAHENHEFMLDYQPIYDAGPPAQPFGFEALLRWRHPELGLISPGQFIPIAENNGMIMPLTVRILEESANRIKLWRKLWPECYLSVNIPPLQMREEGFAALILDTLSKAGLPADALVIEVTENGVPLEERTRATMEDLVERGVRFAIDDFGTGHSSLKYLQKFPFQILKLDRSFIREIPEEGRTATIVKSILALAQSLGLKTVAEGVETASQLSFLQEHHCDAIQGFFLAHPLSPGSISEFTQRFVAGGVRLT